MTPAGRRPTTEEFVAFWGEQTRREEVWWRALRPHATYVLGMVLYVLLLSRIDEPGRLFWVAVLVVGIGYIVGVPWIWIGRFQKRNAAFIRCRQCGDWLGRDESGAWYGPNPKWVSIARTGRCGKCEEQLLTSDGL